MPCQTPPHRGVWVFQVAVGTHRMLWLTSAPLRRSDAVRHQNLTILIDYDQFVA